MEDSTERVADLTISAFAEALASAQPTPGGGAAAALAASLAVSLSAMVIRLSIGRPKYAEHADLHAEALAAADAARARFLDLADADAEAYAGYVAARRLPHDSQEEELIRAAATRDAARTAATVPLTVIQECHQQIDIVERLVGRTNPNVASDLDVAALLLDAGARSAAANVVVNLDATGDQGYADAALEELDERLRQIESATARIRERIGGAAPHGSRTA
jgi:formiminotetrahydrofolate cyclodeaminase